MEPAKAAKLDGPLRRAIIGLGVTQIIGWASTYYLLSLLGEKIGADLGLSSGVLLSGVSIALGMVAVIGPRIGRWQDQAGSRVVMGSGSVFIALGLVVLAFSHSLASYLAGWVVIGIGSPMALYSASFTAVTQMTARQARRAISLLTLLGGLAASIAWPVTAWLMIYLDWRTIILVFAALNLFICLPVHLAVLDRRKADKTWRANEEPVPPGVPAEGQVLAFVLLTLMLTLLSFVFNAWSLLIFRIFDDLTFPLETAILLGSLIGVWQIAGRFIEMVFAGRLSIFWTGLVSVSFLPLALAILLAAGNSFWIGLVFSIFFGISNGLLTIARSGLALVIFGATGYGERIGRIQRLPNVMSAASPIIGGYLIDHIGAYSTVVVMLMFASLALLMFFALRAHCVRHGLR